MSFHFNSFTSSWRSTRRYTEKGLHMNPVNRTQNKPETALPKSEQPNDSWSKDTLDLYKKLKDLVDNSSGAWKKHYPSRSTPGHRMFQYCVDERGKLFEGLRFYNKTEQCLKGVCQFGCYTEGPKGYVHGGAMATILDQITVLLPFACDYGRVLTAKLSVDFKEPLPIGATVATESHITLVDGRKVYIDGKLTSPDGMRTYASAKSLCVVIRNSKL